MAPTKIPSNIYADSPKIGTKTITDLIDAESELLDVNVNYHSSRKDMILNYFNILALEGSLLENFENYLPSYN